jgi:hypothetical protein
MSKTATTTKKPARNKPCPCGSGKKFKRCCGKDQEPGNQQPKIIQGPGLDTAVAQKVLKNDFRKQVNPYEGIPGPELVRRDQMILLAKLETTYNMGELDKAYFADIIENFQALKMAIQSLPPCPERGPSLTDVEAQIVEFTKRSKQAGFNRTNFLTLIALRSVLGQGDVDAEPKSLKSLILEQLEKKGLSDNPEKGDSKLENDNVVEQAMSSTGQGTPAQQGTKPKGDGPIEDSGGGSPDADFLNEPPDQVNEQANQIIG